MAGLTVRTKLPADSSAYLLSCAADDAASAGVVHASTALATALIKTIKSGMWNPPVPQGTVLSRPLSCWMICWEHASLPAFSVSVSAHLHEIRSHVCTEMHDMLASQV